MKSILTKSIMLILIFLVAVCAFSCIEYSEEESETSGEEITSEQDTEEDWSGIWAP